MKILDVPQSGSLAGQTSSRNRFGQYRRTRAVPVNVNSPAQTDVRMNMTNCSQQWRTLTNAQRDAWNYYALANPRVDSLGQTVTPTGLQMFVGVNTLLTLAGVLTITNPPGGAPSATQVIGVDDPSIAGPIALSYSISPISAATGIMVYTSPPRSPGVSFERDFRFVTMITGALSSPQTIGTELAAKWGTIIPGMRFFIRARSLALSGANKGAVTGWTNMVILDTVA